MPTEKIKYPSFSRYQIFVIIFLAFTQFTVVLDFMVMAPLGDLIMKSLEMTPSKFAISVSAYAFSAGVSGVIAAGFADRYDRKKLLVFFYLGFIIGTVFCGLANSYHTLVAARIFTGIFGGVIGSISMAIVTDLFDLSQRGRVMGFVQMGIGASQVLGIPVSLAIAAKWGWGLPFYMVAILGVLIFLGILFILQPVVEHLKTVRTKSPILHLWATFTKRKYRICYAATALLAVSGYLLSPFSSTFVINNLGLNYNQLTVMMMCSGIFSLLLMPFIGRLSDRMPKFQIFTIAIAVMMIVVVIYTNLAVTPFIIVLALNILMLGGMLSRTIPASTLVSAIPKPGDRGAFMSLNASLQQMAGGVGAALSGAVVVQRGVGQPLQHYSVIGILVCVVSTGSWLLIRRVNKMARK